MKPYDWQQDGWQAIPERRPADEVRQAALAYAVVGVLMLLAVLIYVRVGS